LAKKRGTQEGGELPSFEEALEQLEGIVHQLEEGQIGLSEALAQYEKGVKLLRQCYGLLERAERRIELLSGVDADGNPVTTPLDDAPLSGADKAGRPRRSTAGDDGPPERGVSKGEDTDIDASQGLS
jgi:exodeoxyribonuclease VII small subunit